MARKKKEFNREFFDKVVKELHDNSVSSNEQLYKKYGSSEDGLTQENVRKNIEKYGRNETEEKKKVPVVVQYLKSFVNAFIFVLIIIGIITYLTSVITICTT